MEEVSEEEEMTLHVLTDPTSAYDRELVKVLGFGFEEVIALGITKFRDLYSHKMIEDGDAEACAAFERQTRREQQREGTDYGI